MKSLFFNFKMATFILGIGIFAFLFSCGSKKAESSEETEVTEDVAVNNQADIDSITKFVYLLYFDPNQLNEDYDGTPAYTSSMKERMSKVGILSSDGQSLVSQEIPEDQYISQDLKNTLENKNKDLKFSEPFSAQIEIWGGSDHMAYGMDANVIEVKLTSPTTADVKVLNGGEDPINFNLVKENGGWKLDDVNNFKSTVANYQEPSM